MQLVLFKFLDLRDEVVSFYFIIQFCLGEDVVYQGKNGVLYYYFIINFIIWEVEVEELFIWVQVGL